MTKYFKYILAVLALFGAIILAIVYRRKPTEYDAKIKQKEEEIKEIEEKVTVTEMESKEALARIELLKKQVEEIRKKKQEQALVEGDPVAFLRDFAKKKIEEAKGK